MSCSHQERLNIMRAGAVVTSTTLTSSRTSNFRTCTSATSATSTSNARCLPNVSATKPHCGPVLPAVQTPHVCNQELRYHGCRRYRLGSTPVVPWNVIVSVLHGVRDVMFTRSCYLTRNRFLNLVKWLCDTLNITVGYKCTCANDTRIPSTTEILRSDT